MRIRVRETQASEIRGSFVRLCRPHARARKALGIDMVCQEVIKLCARHPDARSNCPEL